MTKTSLSLLSLFRFINNRKRTYINDSKHQMTTKNKWLYPNDNFGKLERGVVHFLESNNLKH